MWEELKMFDYGNCPTCGQTIPHHYNFQGFHGIFCGSGCYERYEESNKNLDFSKLSLENCKRTHPIYQQIRDRHYVENRGCHGQQLHYLIKYNSTIIGIISGASSVWAVKARDEFFGLTKDNKRKGLPSIINNVVFRLEYNAPNLATFILAKWRKRIMKDWAERYNVEVHGFETFVVEEDFRKGALYKADNWVQLGETAGSTKRHKGLTNKSERVNTTPKLIFAKKIKGTQLSTEYTPTWNLKKGKSNDS